MSEAVDNSEGGALPEGRLVVPPKYSHHVPEVGQQDPLKRYTKASRAAPETSM